MADKKEKNAVCEALAEDLVAYVDGELSDERGIELVAHIKSCPECRKLAEDLSTLSGQLKRLPAQERVVPSTNFAEKTEALIRERAEEAREKSGSAGGAEKNGSKDPKKAKVFFLFRPQVMGSLAASLVLVMMGVVFFGDTLRTMFATSVDAVSGNEDEAPAALYHHKSMGQFGDSGGGGYYEAPEHKKAQDQPWDRQYEGVQRRKRLVKRRTETIHLHKNMKNFGQPYGGSQSGSQPMHNRYAPNSPSPSPDPSPRPDRWGDSGADPNSTPPMVNDPSQNGPVGRLAALGNTSSKGKVVFKSGIGQGALHSGSSGKDSFAANRVQEAPEASKNAWYESSYQAGAGERERMEKLVASGVLVDGQKLKLGAFTRSYHQKFKVPAGRALALSTGTDRGKVLTSGGQVFLQVGIQAAQREMSRRPALNIALVIDRSGSMGEGDKMGYARRAALRFVRDLRPDDKVTVVSYDERVEVASSGEGGRDRKSIERFIKKLRPRGATNIYGALDKAYRVVARRSSPELLNTVLLLSDGLPTAGVTTVAEIVGLARTAAEQGISTTTIGMGLDYNDTLMMDLARRGQGHYHFVKDSDSVEGIFRAEFKSLNRVVARALRLRIRLADDVVLRRILGSKELSSRQKSAVRAEERHIDRKVYQELGIKADRQEDDEDGIRMMIPYFFSGDSHVVLLQLEVPPGTDPKRLAEVTLKYKDMLHNKNGMAEREATVRYAQDQDQVVASISRPVKKNLLGYRAAEALTHAAKLVASGDARRASGMVSEQATLFREAGRAWGDAELSRDARLLDEYRNVILSLDSPALAGRDNLRAYLQKTMSHSAYQLTQ